MPRGHYAPVLGSKYVPDQDIALMLVAYNRYKFEGRPLDRDDFHGTFSIKYGQKLRGWHEMLDKFENPQDKFTIKFEALADKDEQEFKHQVDDLFKQLRDIDPKARERNEWLSGFPHRLSKPFLPKKLWWNKEEIPRYKLANIYCMIYCCKNHQGEDLSQGYVRELVQDKVFNGAQSKSTIVKILAQADHEATVLVAGMTLPHLGHFGYRAHDLHVEYTRENNLPKPLLFIHGLPQSDFDVATTTTSMGAMTIGAIASDPLQPFGSGSLPPIASDSREPTPFAMFTDYEGYAESQPTEESSKKDPKGKGKARQRESSSGSPEGEGTEEKEPGRGRKQRESGAAYRARLPKLPSE